MAQDLVQAQDLGLAVDQGEHDDAEGGLELGLLVEVVEHHLGVGVALELDDHADAVAIALVAQIRDAVELLVLDQVGDLLDEGIGAHLVGQLGDDDRVLVALDLLDLGDGAQGDGAAAGGVGLVDALLAQDDGAGREVGALDVLDQVARGEAGLFDHRDQAVDDLAQVVRRDVGRHADRDARGAVDQQVRDARGQDDGLLGGAVVVGVEVDRLGVDVGEHLARDAAEAGLGVAVGRRRVAVDRAEVAVAVDQHVAQREVLRQANHRVIDRGVAVGVVLTEHVADHGRRLAVLALVGQVVLVHGEQDAPVHWLEAVADVRERAPDDDAHGVVEVGLLELLAQRARDDPCGGLRGIGHEGLHPGTIEIWPERASLYHGWAVVRGGPRPRAPSAALDRGGSALQAHFFCLTR
ncbi:hypothetical protein D3C86_1110200 [compost metagenome]